MRRLKLRGVLLVIVMVVVVGIAVAGLGGPDAIRVIMSSVLRFITYRLLGGIL